ncbi:MAG TPA: acetate--CoA ligase family protein [Symbiobacteriaceae bacterium]|jgi:acetyl-CoA synthetase (ADP-forming)
MAVRDVALQALDQVTEACLAEGRYQLTEWETYEVLRRWQIPVAPGYLVQSPAEAAEAAGQIGSRVAVKIVSPHIAHKTDAGCVMLSIVGPEAAAEAYAAVLNNARFYEPDARIDGVLIQKMAPPGVEVIAGGVFDPSFGPVVMAGLGGIFTEVLKDVRFRLAPIVPEQALEMLQELKGYPLLAGVRGKPPVDLRALTQTLSNISRLMEAWKGLKELDLNPLIAWEGGVLAVDGLATLTPKA